MDAIHSENRKGCQRHFSDNGRIMFLAVGNMDEAWQGIRHDLAVETFGLPLGLMAENHIDN